MKKTFLQVLMAAAILKASFAFECKNDVDFRFQSEPKKSCNWIKRYEDRRQEHCSLYSEVREACIHTCGMCCQDDETYSFVNNIGEEKTCDWLTHPIKGEKRRDAHCGTYDNGSMVRNACQLSCDFCFDKVDVPTVSPSVSTAPTTSAPTKAPITAEFIQRTIATCQDNSLFRYGNEDRKTCDWIGMDEIRRETLCSEEEVQLECPSACRLCCKTDEDFSFQIPSGKMKNCNWLKKDVRQVRYCPMINSGTLIENKCPFECGICKKTEAPSMSVAPTQSPTSKAYMRTNIMLTCSDSPTFLWKGEEGKTCDWIGESQSRMDKLCGRGKVQLACPQSCKLCCEDDASFTFSTPTKTGKTCDWLSKDPRKIELYCTEDYMDGLVARKCPVTCEQCFRTPHPSNVPSISPTSKPSATGSDSPSAKPTASDPPTMSQQPTMSPSVSKKPSLKPSSVPSVSFLPSTSPTQTPSISSLPSSTPTLEPSSMHSSVPSSIPSVSPSLRPSSLPSTEPSMVPSVFPSALPTGFPSVSSSPSRKPSDSPSGFLSGKPTLSPSLNPSHSPSSKPTKVHSSEPSKFPSASPSHKPSKAHSEEPSHFPTLTASSKPSLAPSLEPSFLGTLKPSISKVPTASPSVSPSQKPSFTPSFSPSNLPSPRPSFRPSSKPSESPSKRPTNKPSPSPSTSPTLSQSPSEDPGCVDSTELFKIEGVSTQKTCDWVLAGRKNKKCTEYPEVIENCPVTCDICPTMSPSPTVQNQPREVVECSLEFQLAHMTTAVNAVYYGVHQDVMFITKDGDNEYSCSGENIVYYPGDQASWCDYDSTYIDGDYYGATTYYMDGKWGEAPWQSDETIIVNNAAGSTYRINVKHIYQEEDYYYTDDYYSGDLYYDHMMPAYLKVKNQNNNSVIAPIDGTNYEPVYGWHHPVSVNQSTHEKGRPNMVNDEYEGNFEVTVSCDNSCFCSAVYQVV